MDTHADDQRTTRSAYAWAALGFCACAVAAILWRGLSHGGGLRDDHLIAKSVPLGVLVTQVYMLAGLALAWGGRSARAVSRAMALVGFFAAAGMVATSAVDDFAGASSGYRLTEGGGAGLEIWIRGFSAVPGTLLVVLVVALTWLLHVGPRAPSQVLKQISLALGSLALALSSLGVLLPMLGESRHLGDDSGVLALLVAAGFCGLSACLVLDATRGQHAPRGSMRESVADAESPQWFERGTVLFFCLIATALALAGALYLRSYRENVRHAVAESIEAVADLKVEQVCSWRNERINDARLLVRAPGFADQVRSLLEEPDNPMRRDAVVHWLSMAKGGLRYERVDLLDLGGTSLLAPHALRRVPLSAPISDCLERCRQTRDAAASDLGISSDGQPFLVVAAPVEILSRRSGDPSSEPVLLGYAVMEADPRSRLFALVQSWPTPTETGEVILARHEGRRLVPLEGQRAEAAVLKANGESGLLALPDGQTDSRVSGVSDAVDFRGERVIACVRSVPGTKWMIVAKINHAEVFAPVRRAGWTVSLLVLLLFGATALGAAVVWRRNAAVALERRLKIEQERKILAERLAVLMRHANDIIVITDAEGGIIEVNERACEAYGYDAAQLKRLHWRDLASPATTATKADADSEKGIVYEDSHRRHDGTLFPVEVSSRVVSLGERPSRLAIVRDISQRRAHEKEIERLNRAYAALSLVNEMVVRVTDEQELLRAVCQIMTRNGRFDLAWVGRRDESASAVVPVAWEGRDAQMFDGLGIPLRPEDDFSPPTLIAVREGRADVCRDVAEPRMSRWRDMLVRHSLRTAAAFPIRRGGSIWGNLTVYSEDRDAFGVREFSLLEETAVDISYALDVIDDRQRHRRVELALRESESRLRTLFKTMTEIVALHEVVRDGEGRVVDYRIIDCNDSYCAGFGIARERALGALASALYARSEPPYLDEFAAVVQSGHPYSFEAEAAWLGKVLQISVAPMGADRFATITTDITERRRAEAELKESEQRFRATFEQAAAGIAHVAPDGRFLRVNQRLCDLLGYSRGELLALSFQKITHEADLGKDLELVAELVAGEIDTYSIEKRYLRKGGTDVWAQLTVSLVRLLDGAPSYLIAVVQDVSERKAAEEALRRSEERFRRLTEAVTDYVYSVRVRDGRAIETVHGPGCVSVTGYTEEDFSADPLLWLDMVVEEDRPAVLEQIRRLLEDGEIEAVEHRLRRKDGCVRWVRNTHSVQLDRDGHLIGYDGLIQDITERKVAEIGLREANDELQATNRVLSLLGSSIEKDKVLDLILDESLSLTKLEEGVVCLLAADGSMSRMACRGNPPTMVSPHGSKEPIAPSRCLCGDCVRTQRARILDEADAVDVACPQAGVPAGDSICFHASYPLVAQGKCLGVLCLFTRKPNRPTKGALRLMEALCTPFALAVQNALLHADALRFATELEDQVRSRTAELEATNKELEAFSYSVSHDLRAPLRAINGFAQILTEDYGATLDEEGRRVLSIVSRESQRMGQLIDDLLAFSRLGRKALVPVRVDMNRLVEEVRESLMQRESTREVVWRVGRLPMAFADPTFLRQALENLLGNALKYTRRKAVAEITVSGEQLGGDVVYRVADNGAGFDPRYAGKLFGVFQRLHSESEFEGNGVGLALAQRIIHRHGGRIWAEGKLGEGATFHFALPKPPDSERSTTV